MLNSGELTQVAENGHNDGQTAPQIWCGDFPKHYKGTGSWDEYFLRAF
jgi:hypothetical protein